MSTHRYDRLWQEIVVALRHILIDMALYAGSAYLGLLLRFEFRVPAGFAYAPTPPVILELSIFACCDIALHLPQSMWRFTDVGDEWRVLGAVFLAKALASFWYLLFLRQYPWSRGAYLAGTVLAVAAMVAARALRRTLYEQLNRQHATHDCPTCTTCTVKRVLIAGAGSAGEKLLREYEGHHELGCVVGLLDDDPQKSNCLLRGKRVLGRIDDAPEVVREVRADELVVAIPSHQAAVTRRLMTLTADLPVVVKTLPALWQIADGSVLAEQIHNVQLADLLQRSVVQTDLAPVASIIRGRAVLVTGAGGSIGSEIVRQVARFEPQTLVMLGRGENRIFRIDRELCEKDGFHRAVPVIGDMRDVERMQWLFDRWHPDIVLHAAAHKHVPLMERNPEEAILNNVGGTRILLQMAREHDTKRFINISTDKAVDAVNFMGASKRIVEIMVQEYDRHAGGMRCTSVRFGNVLGSNGSVIEAFQSQLRETRTLRVTDPDMKRFFMLIPEAVQLVLQAGALARGNDIFVLRMGDPINIVDLARTYIKLSGLEVGTDASIVITGNRGNEKINEELCSACEHMEATSNSGIMRIVCPPYAEAGKLSGRLDALCAAAGAHDVEELRTLLHEIDSTINVPAAAPVDAEGAGDLHFTIRRMDHE